MIAWFCLQLIAGIAMMWVAMPRAEVTAGFFRIQMMFVMALSVVALLTFGKLSGNAAAVEGWLTPGVMGSGLLACLAYVGSVMWTLQRRPAGNTIVYTIAAISLSMLAFLNDGSTPLAGRETATGIAWLRVASDFSTAALLGSAMTGMLLGHWYLTAKTMSLRPLQTLTWYFGLAVGLRCVVSALCLAVAWSELSAQTHWIWLGLRWSAGVVGPLIMFALTWQILRYRNTQAATGVLFAGVIMTFIGELTARLLWQELHLPL
mgnify:FL=1